MKYSFTCYGHENITAMHKTTLEFTKDSEIGLEGDCIIGIKADFQLSKIKQFIKKISNNRKITIIIETINNINNKKNINQNNKNKINNNIIEEIDAEINPGFNSDKEMVIRKTDFVSERTFAIKANKGAFELSRGLVAYLKERNNKIRIVVESK